MIRRAAWWFLKHRGGNQVSCQPGARLPASYMRATWRQLAGPPASHARDGTSLQVGAWHYRASTHA